MASLWSREYNFGSHKKNPGPFTQSQIYPHDSPPVKRIDLSQVRAGGAPDYPTP